MTTRYVHLDQQRAAFAWQRLTLERVSPEYTTIAKGAPALIMTSGLMQVLAFLQDKGKGSDQSAHARLAGDLRAWLATALPELDLVDEGSSANRPPAYAATMNELQQARVPTYRRATQEALEILRWIRQFAPTLQDTHEGAR